MPRYLTYIALHLLWPTLLITVGLTSIIWLTQALRFVDFIVNRGLAIGDFITITSLLFPELLNFLTPIALFLAVIFTYHKLQSDSELTVFGAMGLSRMQLAAPIMLVALFAVAFCFMLSLYLQPTAMRQLRDMQSFLRNNYSSVLLQEEVFNTPIEGLTVFVRERDSSANLRGILVHDNRISGKPITMMAEQGKLIQGASGPQFYLEKGMRQERRNGRVSWLNFDQYTIDISFYAGVLNDRDRKSDERFLGELFDSSIEDPKLRTQLRAEGHQRVLWPLYNLVLALFASSMMLSGAYSRRGQWKKMALATTMAFAIILAGVGLKNLASAHAFAVPLMYGFAASVGIASIVQLFGAWPKQLAAVMPYSEVR